MTGELFPKPANDNGEHPKVSEVGLEEMRKVMAELQQRGATGPREHVPNTVPERMNDLGEEIHADIERTEAEKEADPKVHYLGAEALRGVVRDDLMEEDLFEDDKRKYG